MEEEDGGGGVTEIYCESVREGNRLRLAAYTHAQSKPTNLDIHLHNKSTA